MTDIIANLVGNAASDYYNLEKKIHNLKRKLELLNCQEADVVARLSEEERCPGKKRKNVVNYWLTEVVSKQKEFESLEAEVNQNSRISRVTLAKRADEMIEEVTGLVDQGIFSEGVVLDISETTEEKFVTAEWKGQAFKRNFQTVRTCLLGNEVSSIGVFGMGGVGKTTLSQCIFNELKNEAIFCSNIFWFTVSQDFNIHKLQNEIGKALNLDLSDEDDEDKRAGKLGQAWKTKNRSVLMLDDVWTPFSLQMIGISSSLAKDGFKFVVISRSMEVCRKMDCQKYLKVEVLLEEEAWELFMNKLSNGIGLPCKVEKIAIEVAKKCAGLSLAIITMAGSLRGVTDIHEWRDVLEELNESCMGQDDMENEVFPILLCSYNRLRDPVLKRCFLYCSLYPKDFPIERSKLIKHFILEQLMERRISRRAYFDQGHKILNKLENVCLLERSEDLFGEEEHVKMHDLIRDMALKITKDNCMVKAGLQLVEIPEEQEWKEDLDKVSLIRNNIERIQSVTSPNCPKLSTLLLSYNPLKSIPDSFFLQMRGLHVLNLSHTKIKYMPSSISDLEELNALLLGYCQQLVHIPPLGNLKALEELDLSYSGIMEIPQGVERLTNLKCLDTIGSNIKTTPTGILQGLSLLHRLTLPTQMTIPIEEVAGLKQLKEIEGKFCNVHDFNIFMKARSSDGKLNFYDIQIGDFYPMIGDPEILHLNTVNFGKDSLNKGKRGKDEIMLPRDIEFLRFEQCGLSSYLSDFQQVNNLTELKACRIEEEEGIEFIVRLSPVKEQMAEEEQQSSLMPLHYLESLSLWNLQNFIGLIRWEAAVAPLPPGPFSHLQRLEIFECGKMKKLLPQSLLQNLHNLKWLRVDSCAQMEEIIGDDEIDGNLAAESNTVFNLPRLEALYLRELPELKSFCKGTIICNSIKYITLSGITKVRKVSLFPPPLNRQPFPPPSLRDIRIPNDEKGWWESLDWDLPNAKSVLQPFVKYYDLGVLRLHDKSPHDEDRSNSQLDCNTK